MEELYGKLEVPIYLSKCKNVKIRLPNSYYKKLPKRIVCSSKYMRTPKKMSSGRN